MGRQLVGCWRKGALLQLRAASLSRQSLIVFLFWFQLEVLPCNDQNRDNRVLDVHVVIPAPARVRNWDPSWLTIQLKTGSRGRAGSYNGLGAENIAVGSIHQPQTRSCLRLSWIHTRTIERQGCGASRALNRGCPAGATSFITAKMQMTLGHQLAGPASWGISVRSIPATPLSAGGETVVSQGRPAQIGGV